MEKDDLDVHFWCERAIMRLFPNCVSFSFGRCI